MKLLIVKGTDRSSKDSVSALMYETFYNEAEKYNTIETTVYDTYVEDMPYIGNDLFAAYGKNANKEELTASEERVYKASVRAKELFKEADVVCFAFPMYNLSVPANVRTFIDYIFEAGFTFKYNEEGQMVQLMKDKKIILLNARGGIYSGEGNRLDMCVNYMSTALGTVLGMNITDEIIIEGHNQNPNRADELKEAGLSKVREAVRKLA